MHDEPKEWSSQDVIWDARDSNRMARLQGTGRSVVARTTGSEDGEPGLALDFWLKIEIPPASRSVSRVSREITVVIALPCVRTQLVASEEQRGDVGWLSHLSTRL
ncbi:hypothetical protein KC318_g74 [Hortaea werneckii]|nr:hypothetical protein KC334_g72 [Hortaea werneckii]KAI7028372.1 hypothetical protein KC355_g73 [Hortaea werneckii]KAI7676754.1 hypothetical protein KC318_g74 [Hortaea werneckii]